MPLLNMNSGSETIAETRIDPLIARDSEVTAALNAHTAAADPHPIYLSQTEGDARYRLSSQAIPESAIDSLIARFSEVLRLEQRSGGVRFDADLASFNGFKWIDGTVSNSNLPINSGFFLQVDALLSTPQAGQYKLNFFLALSQNRIWMRSQFAGQWSAWKEL
ncbi:MAG: pyocin knob domain-containing protein [Microcoleaceae cyanobacterium]